MYTIGQLAKKFNLSRSTLLYYDSIGLLAVPVRTAANYRTYSQDDCRRLEQICMYREAGLPLQIIKELLAGAGSSAKTLLETRVYEVSKEIIKLRGQQKAIVRLLLNYQAQKEHGYIMDWQAWGELFQAAGFSDYDQWKWHREFEMASPDKHQQLLVSMGLHADRIIEIRAWSQGEYLEIHERN